ncbi:MAG: TIGR03943 family protein [Bacillota bacterium]|nr:TIGR03943 family protein [Bacillota bacterium]
MVKKFDRDALIWTAILLLILYSFARMIYSGDIKNYIHPDMVKYTVFGTLAIFLMVLNGLGQIFKESSHDKIRFGYLLFLLPVLIYLLLRPSGLSESTAVNRGVNLLFYKTLGSTELGHNHTHEHGDGNMVIDRGTIIIGDNNFFTSIKEIYGNIQKYKDNAVDIKGFVLIEKGVDKEFILSRMIISCCAADTEVIGIKCQYDKLQGLSGGQWVQVRGRFKQSKPDSLPVLSVEGLKVIEKPQNNYIYRD